MRKIDPSLQALTEEELNELGRAYYDLGNLIFDTWREENFGSKNPVGLLTRDDNSDKL